MKTIKVKFVGFWEDFNPKNSIIYKLLSNNYNFEISDNPDYVICSCFGKPYSYLKYPQIRIMICGENYTPDFNFIDYAIHRYPITFLDRSFYEPGCLRPYPDCMALERHAKVDETVLRQKVNFCSFVASHESEHNIRGDFFKKLCEYKKVLSIGTFLNNTSIYVNREDGTKLDFNKSCKFVLCFESTKNDGFLTEKINEAFLANAIPIYYGSSTCANIYNPKSLIDVSKFDSFDKAIEYIKKIDNDDKMYLNILNEPKFKTNNYLSRLIEEEILFLRNIFEQPIEKAYRRSRVYAPFNHEQYIKSLQTTKKMYLFRKILIFFKNKFKKL